MSKTLVLITGTGRSGTSTMSGTLHHLGLHVPGPYLGANESNPKGFFESSWAVQFHKQITAAARINDFDSRPSAFARSQAAITPELRGQLAAYLAENALGHDQVVVKDPRSVWAQALWQEVAAESGFDIAMPELQPGGDVRGPRRLRFDAGGEHGLVQDRRLAVAKTDDRHQDLSIDRRVRDEERPLFEEVLDAAPTRLLPGAWHVDERLDRRDRGLQATQHVLHLARGHRVLREPRGYTIGLDLHAGFREAAHPCRVVGR